MKNGLKIRWTEESINNLENIISYLESNWTNKELIKFFIKLEKQIQIISVFPEAYPLSKRKGKVHRCVFIKILTIYYVTDNEHLIILSLFDNRQYPKKRKEK